MSAAGGRLRRNTNASSEYGYSSEDEELNTPLGTRYKGNKARDDDEEEVHSAAGTCRPPTALDRQYSTGTSLSAPQSIVEKPMEVNYLNELIIITLHVAGFLHPVII